MTYKVFETKNQAEDYAKDNCPNYVPTYESGYYEKVTGLKKGWYLTCGQYTWEE